MAAGRAPRDTNQTCDRQAPWHRRVPFCVLGETSRSRSATASPRSFRESPVMTRWRLVGAAPRLSGNSVEIATEDGANIGAAPALIAEMVAEGEERLRWHPLDGPPVGVT